MRKLKWKSASILTGIALIGMTAISCSKQENIMPSKGSSLEEVLQFTKSKTPLVNISYEAEVLSRMIQTGTNKSSYPQLDMVATEPIVSRQAVALSIMPDGTFITSLKNLTPQNSINIPHKNLPNTSIPEPQSSILSNQEMRIYDLNGKELYTSSMNIPPMSDFVDAIYEMGENYEASTINEALTNLQPRNYIQNLDNYLNNPEKYNAIVSDQGQGFYSVKEPLRNAGALPSAVEGDYAIHIFDYNRNLLVGTGIYDKQDVMKDRVMFIYDDKTNLLKTMRQETQETLPSGLTAYIETVTEIANLTLNFNY